MHDSGTPHSTNNPMGFGELLDRTIQLFRQGWRPLLLLGLLGALPALISSLINKPNPVSIPVGQFLISAYQNRPGSTAGTFLLMIINSLTTLLVEGALILVAAQLVHRHPLDLRAGLRTAWERFGAIWSTSFVAGLLYVVAVIVMVLVQLVLSSRVITLVLTVVSFFLLSLIFIFKSQALLLEELDGGSEPLTRSKALVLARFWPILGFTLLLQVGRYLVSLGWGLLLQLPVRMLQGVAWHGEALHIASLLEVLPRVLTLPVVTIGMTLLYFDTRMRQEGLDLTAPSPTE